MKGLPVDKSKRGNAWSRFWAGDYIYDHYDELSPTDRLMHLSTVRRGISNFVKVLTKKDIPVRFSTGQMSYTEGRTVVISAEEDPAQYDVLVGIALHEALHVVYSQAYLSLVEDFNTYPQKFDSVMSEVYRIALSRFARPAEKVRADVSLWMNFLEDRRIDNIGYQLAVGFRPYYEARYDDHFRSDFFDAALQHPMLRNPWMKCYETFIINIANRYYDPDALPGLRHITDVINLDNIDRYTNDPLLKMWQPVKDEMRHTPSMPRTGTYDRKVIPQMLLDAIEIAKTIYENAVKAPKGEEPKEGEEQQAGINLADDDDISEGKQGQKQGKGDPDNLDQPTGCSGKGRPQEKNDKNKAKGKPSGQPNDPQPNPSGHPQDGGEFEKQLDKALKEAQDAINGKKEGKQLSDEDARAMEELEAAGTELREIKGISKNSKCKVLVYKKMTINTLKVGNNIFGNTGYGTNLAENAGSKQALTDGIRIGSALAYRIRILNDEDVEKNTRRPSGRIDKRLIHSLSFAENVFEITSRVALKPVMVDISIDASGSMGSSWYGNGGKWKQALTLAIALAFTSSKIRNLRVRINLRASDAAGVACVGVIFDSKFDKFIKLQQMAPYLWARGGTPEGLCFEAIRKELLEEIKQTRRFFINLSDGLPEFQYVDTSGVSVGYYGEAAAHHTRGQVEDIRKEGVSILSYFITEGRAHGKVDKQFTTMYGKDAAYINMDSIPDLVRTLNKLFLKE